MTKIKDILSIHLEEDIKSVIDLNQQDDKSVIDELDGFILTESLAKHLADFCDFYVSNTSQPGLWLSGFYGSGKSYFSKMIGFLLKNPVLSGTSIRDRFANKLIGLPNASLLQNSINELGRSKNHVVLFDAAKTTGNHGICYMMMGAFLKSLNLNDDWVGIVEFNLIMSGRYEAFCDKVKEKFGEPWTARRKNMDLVYDTLEDTMLDGFCSENAYDEMRDAAKQRIQDYDANKLQEDLTRYLEKNPDLRIVFMIDEVSEAIAQQKINILDLEGMAESIAALGRKIWTIAIAQLQLDDVINGTNVNKSLLTKIIDRFRNRIPIAAEEVDTIIRKRLLAKTADGNAILQDYYKKNSGQISDITNLVGTGLKKTTDAKTYADYYPFYEHQFKMLQYFLFGTHKLVKTQVGTRGMLISAFDVLKKETMADRDIFVHVNASQLCRNAEESVPESLRARYNQADEHLTDIKLKFVVGHDMLQTIHFLTESGAKTTVENISRAYVNCPNDYFTVLEEVKKACKRLADDEILILSGDEYRITSETQQRIFEMMANYDGIANYRIKGEITKEVKKMQLVRQAQTITADSGNVTFTLQTDGGEPLNTGGNPNMKVVFHDILNVKPSLGEYVDKVKEETQSDKNTICVIPSPDYASEIQQAAETILRILYIKDVPNLTDEEKKVVAEIVGTLEDKTRQLEQAIVKSYDEGRLVYLYNVSIMQQQSAPQIIKDTELKMYDNIYTKRLGGTLKDSIALQLLKVGANQLQNTIGSQPDFQFFDTSGQFIGDQLPVITEIMAHTATYNSGADLERDLGAAPTGYTFGTIFSTLAALFRASKIIIKYNNQEYHSWQQDGAKEPFMTARNFQRASFKAVTKSLGYNEKRDIVDTLKDCNFKQLTGSNLSYNMNDFELVDAIRLLAVTEIQKVNNNICNDDERERLFRRSIAAKDLLLQYAKTVTDTNYFTTARTFLNDNDNEEFVNAIDKIEKDIRFINENLKTIEGQKSYLLDVKDEMEFVGIPMQAFDTLNERYSKMLESDPVHNYQQMQQVVQQVRDLYYQYMQQYAESMTQGYCELDGKLEQVRKKAEEYPKEWNASLITKLDDKQKTCRRYAVTKIELKHYDIRCCRCHLQLRDIDNAIKMLPQLQTEADVFDTEVKTTASTPPQPPTPSPSPGPQPQPQPQPQPTVRKLRSQLPTGQLSVAQYKQWLKQQLAMVNSYDEKDILKFDE
ncbi:BREX system P-loop protein BrxC [Prevotella sp. P2-180]|uniref:BREX system P-loop protein BrxC n=1 Tax=Prevotella sp. P2-180 TaxID=2024224 RepID=UPI000B970ED7|nr:BREX system P-loop protein BrxC [Prevotella sp. P2-180]OYP69167.1 hypothetical protein CIK98_02125 [Prevotella sp. P2-180]